MERDSFRNLFQQKHSNAIIDLMNTKTVTVIVLILCLLANIANAGMMNAAMTKGKAGTALLHPEVEPKTQFQNHKHKQKGLEDTVFKVKSIGFKDNNTPCHQREDAPKPCCEQECPNCVSTYAAPIICFSNLIVYTNSSVSKPSGQFPSLRPVKHYRPPII